MSETPPKELGISVSDEVKAKDAFGQIREQVAKGIAGTLHVSTEQDLERIPKAAWELAKSAGKPVVVVFRPPSP